MYILLLVVHSIFIGIAHLLGNYILEGIFILLLLFFLLYFSPVFFGKKDVDSLSFSIPKISFSLQESLILPMLFFYTAVFLLFFAVSGDIVKSLGYGIVFFIITYVFFGLYMIAFEWKNDMFFDIARIHMSFSFIVIFLFIILSLLSFYTIGFTLFLLIIVTLIFSGIYFRYVQDVNIFLFQGFIFLLMLLVFIISVIITGVASYSFLLFTFGFSGIILFEIMPRYTYFQPFLPASRVYVLITFLVTYFLSIFGAFFAVNFYAFVLVAAFFLFFVHIRYSNYIAFFSAIFGIFFLYSLIFFPLLTTSSITSTLLFVFFLPLCIIGNTYFWEERFLYDFKALHYSSIVFSLVFSLYSITFLAWGDLFFFIFSLSVFSLGLLLFLSYLRFRTK